ncbi:MAG TPA: TIGR03560 family F420-dependent LLM class oxidoreductase [Candidatus Bathyarchaeia archaeon]|nr:TIGR03560 family F420-dependent LLM class oxidoreductase [Candidatus Bathyarchaeia archaeon]
MRFGIQTPQYRTDLASLIATWRAAERLGFRSAWLMDHLYPILAPPTEPILEAWTTLAALAGATERIRLGILVAANTFRHPALVARMAATVDQASRGRLEVGLGAAWCEVEHVEQGIPFPPLGERLTMLDEACAVLRGLWEQERLSFSGRYYRLTNAACAPKPVQTRLPLLLGGQGERRALKIVARHAQRWNLSGSLATVRRKREVLAGHCRTLGRDPSDVAVTVRNDFFLTEDRAAADAAIARFAKYARIDVEEARARVWIGNRRELVASFRALADAGVDECILGLGPPYDGAVQEMLGRVASEIVPEVEGAVAADA